MDDTLLTFEHEDRDDGFAQPIHRAVLRDARLSFDARGLFSMVWDFPKKFQLNKRQLMNMAAGIRQSRLNNMMKELRRVGALEYSPTKLDQEGADALNKMKGKKVYKAGQLVGQTWIAHHPKRWAVEHDLRGNPLKPLPNGASTVCRKNRPTAKTVTRKKPCDGFSDPLKVHQGLKGSPTTTTTTKGGGGDVGQSQPPKNKTPVVRTGGEEAGQKTNVLRNVSLADCCSPHQLALAAAAAAAGLDSRGTQKLADALAGALQAPEGAPGRLISRDKPAAWLQSTAAKIKHGDFVETVAYLTAVANRQAHAAETGAGGVTIEPGRYVTQKGAIAIVSDRSTVVEIHQIDGVNISIPLSRLVTEVAAGSVMLTPVPPDAEAA